MARRDNESVDAQQYGENDGSQPEKGNDGGTKAGSSAHSQHERSRLRPSNLARAAALSGVLFGTIILIGWFLRLSELQSLWPGWPRIPPNGGLLSVLVGAALAAKIERRGHRLYSAAGSIMGLAAAAIGLVTLLEYAFNWNAGIDGWLLREGLTAQVSFQGRVSFPAALNGFLLGMGIAVLDVRVKQFSITQMFAAFATLVALLALIGHLCGLPEFYGQLKDRHVGMGPQAMLGMLLFSVGLLCARPDQGMVAVLWSDTPGGVLARRLLLVPVMGLLLTAVVYFVFTDLIPVERAVRTWALGLSNLFFVTVPIWGAAHVLHKMGLERDRAHQELEERVLQRTAELSEANRALHAEISERQQVENALREARDGLENQAIQLEQRVEERTAKLAETIGDLEAFSYSVAHDMRAPLRGMQGFAHLLMEEHAAKLDLEARDYLDRIASSASRMDLLIQDALHYTQVLRSETELKVVDLDKSARQLITTFPGWQPPSAEIIIVGTLIPILAHEGFIVQCLSNLIGNAIKFVPPGTAPRVRIWTEAHETHVRLYIEDNGIGIAPKDHDRVFRMFERLNGADEYEGTGIGLTVVRKAVERMRGRVDFESEPGRGCKFWIEFQKAPSA